MTDTAKSNIATTPAIRVTQPLGTFFAFCIHADVLNDIAYSQPAEVIERLDQEEADSDKRGYSIFGTQRGEKKKRLEEIASFIRTTEATFPNAIILAANYDEQGNYIDEDSCRWTAQEESKGRWALNVPLGGKSASIIDGQHRLHAFDKLPPDAPERKMELLCVVFLELPVPYHAYVFATINFNQKKVDRSLAYELFGFDVDERPAKFWSPETLAVYLARLLNTEAGSPLQKSIFPAAENEIIFGNSDESGKQVVRISMATVVDGILRLISRNPKEDRNTIRRPENIDEGRECLKSLASLPLRSFYISGNDKAIYDLICNYFSAVQHEIWDHVGAASYLRKTVGVQALFDVLKVIVASRPITSDNFSETALRSLLSPCNGIDSSGTKYEASGIGRSEIRKELLSAIGLS